MKPDMELYEKHSPYLRKTLFMWHIVRFVQNESDRKDMIEFIQSIIVLPYDELSMLYTNVTGGQLGVFTNNWGLSAFDAGTWRWDGNMDDIYDIYDPTDCKTIPSECCAPHKMEDHELDEFMKYIVILRGIPHRHKFLTPLFMRSMFDVVSGFTSFDINGMIDFMKEWRIPKYAFKFANVNYKSQLEMHLLDSALRDPYECNPKISAFLAQCPCSN